MVTCEGDARSVQMRDVVREVFRANRPAALVLEEVDIDDSPSRARQLGVMEYPAVIFSCDGVERGRLEGVQSRRAVLHMLLPELHQHADMALQELRRQLDSPGEHFPRKVLKRHERVGKAARLTMMRRVPLFTPLSKRNLARLGAAADEVVLDAGSTLLREGEAGDACYMVATGSLSVRRGRRKVAALGSGDFVGEMSLLDGGPRTATVTADERCVLLALDREAFRAMLAYSPELAISMLEVMSARLRAADARLSD